MSPLPLSARTVSTICDICRCHSSGCCAVLKSMATTTSVSLPASDRSPPASRAHPNRNPAVLSAIDWLAKFDPAVAQASAAAAGSPAAAGSAAPATISVTAKTSEISHPGLLIHSLLNQRGQHPRT
ncbi:hypothetical protein STENM327S_04025 [Streptomyces tendae]